MQNKERGWSISVGMYPGILIGTRVYEQEDYKTYVLSFIDLAFEIDN